MIVFITNRSKECAKLLNGFPDSREKVKINYWIRMRLVRAQKIQKELVKIDTELLNLSNTIIVTNLHDKPLRFGNGVPFPSEDKSKDS